ncbi:MAG: energy transducer TonB [Verrucomicrobia bacterium]|nr:energy transducer TonB [Verrucomicrobiota bacterium]
MKIPSLILISFALVFGSYLSFAETKPAEPIKAYELEELDKEPEALIRIAPKYPKILKRNRKNGTVIIQFIVDEMGKVIDPKIVKSTNALFDPPSLEAVVQWKYKPGMKDGKAVRTRIELPLKFRLRR